MKVLLFLLLFTTSVITVFAQCEKQPCPTAQGMPQQVVFQPEITPLQIPPGGMEVTAYLDNVPNVQQFIQAYVVVQTPQGLARKYVRVQIAIPPSHWKQEFGANSPAGYKTEHDPETGVTAYRYISPKPIKCFVKIVDGVERFFYY